MKKVIAALAASAMMVPAIAGATALEDAREANICDVTAAEYLEDGRLKVVCVPGTVNPAYAGAVVPAGAVPGVLAGTGLTAGAGAGVLATVIVIGVLAGGDDGAGTTTTTGN